MEVPFLSQRFIRGVGTAPGTSTAPALDWRERACAVACLTMVLRHFGRAVTMEEVLRRGLDHAAFDPRRGWLHSGQVAVLQSYGLVAWRRNWRLMEGRETAYLAGRPAGPATDREIDAVTRQLLEEGMWTLRRLTAEIPVIVSVLRPWGDTGSIGHQVVLLGVDDDCVTFHDPATHSGARSRHAAEEFFRSWKGTAVVALDEDSPLNPSRG